MHTPSPDAATFLGETTFHPVGDPSATTESFGDVTISVALVRR